MIAVPDSPRLRTVLALRRLNSVLSMTNRAVGAVLGIKDADLTVLDVLHREGPLTPTELARRTRTHLATMTGVLRRLERGGWVERRPDAADRRSVRIHTAGVNRLTDVYARTDEELVGLISDWSDEQVSMLVGFLDADERCREPPGGRSDDPGIRPTAALTRVTASRPSGIRYLRPCRGRSSPRPTAS